MLMFTLAISFDHFQLTLIHSPAIPGSYAILFFTALAFTSITSHIHNWVFFLPWLCLFILELFLHCSPVAYWAPTKLWNSSFNVLSFCLFILFMGSSRQEYWSGLPFPSPVDHVLSELSTMTPIRLGWPYTAWLRVSLSYTRLWSMLIFSIYLTNRSFWSLGNPVREARWLDHKSIISNPSSLVV